MKLNPLTQIDFYKTGHVFQYPVGTEDVYSNFTARSDRLAPVLRSGLAPFDGKVVFVGLQGFIKDFLMETFDEGFFKMPKNAALRRYQRRMDTSLGPGVVTVDHIAALHDLGYLPLVIKALPEGSRVNLKVPLFTLRATDPRFFWLVNYIEDVLSNSIWKPTTVATIAFQYRRLLLAYAELTGGDKAFVDFQAHDFSCRGMSGPEDSARTSFGHLASFVGTDAVASLDYAEDYYGANADVEYLGGGVPATEHSVMSMGGAGEDELATYRRLITEVYPAGIVSIVSDTWDYWRVVGEYTRVLKDEILNRKPDAMGNAKLVLRPDSGDPVHILCGYRIASVADTQTATLMAVPAGTEVVECEGKYYQLPADFAERQARCNAGACCQGECQELALREMRAEEANGSVAVLWEIFGGTVTDKGFKVLNPRVGLIYGDSITLERCERILLRLVEKGFASTNVVFGVGSFSYQYLSRDSFGFAMKATWGQVNGEGRELSKDPVTDNGVKKSARGLLRVEREGDDFVLYERQTPEQEAQGALEEVFRDGRLLRDETLAQLRERVRQSA